MQKLIEKSINDLGQRQQSELVGDIFEIYFNEHVLKMQSNDDDIAKVEDEFLFTISCLINQFATPEKTIQLLTKVVQSCVSQGFQPFNEKLCLILGQKYMQRSFCSKAYMFFLRANDIPSAVMAVKQVMKSGYQGEQDLFVVRLCFEILIRNYKNKEAALAKVSEVIESFKDRPEIYGQSPLVNFARLLSEAIRLDGDQEAFKMLVGFYKPQLQRDMTFLQYVDRIARYYFDCTIKEANPMQQMIQNMMGGGAQAPVIQSLK